MTFSGYGGIIKSKERILPAAPCETVPGTLGNLRESWSLGSLAEDPDPQAGSAAGADSCGIVLRKDGLGSSRAAEAVFGKALKREKGIWGKSGRHGNRMILNTQQLQYLIEIERTRSISQAAANLYMGQPNLSRVLREAEAGLGFLIFERTRKGVRPTEKGARFLQHARNMLREMDFIERLGPNSSRPNRFRICLPRSYVLLDVVRQFLCGLEQRSELDAMIRECHPRQALELVDSGSVEAALIRYCVEYQDYFSEQAAARKLALQRLSQVEYQIVVQAESPLSGDESISREQLKGCTELLHRDTFYPMNRMDNDHSQIYTVDRMAQIQLLQAMPSAYLWAEPLPGPMLEANRLIQRPCAEGGVRYQNALVYKPQCAMSGIEREFIRWIGERGI